MNMNDLERIVNEYCDGLKEQMLHNISHFESDWNGFHVRALAQMCVEYDHPSIKKAKKDIRTSMNYYQMRV